MTLRAMGHCTGTTTALYWYGVVYIGKYLVNPQRVQNVYGKVGYRVFKAAKILIANSIVISRRF